MSGKTKKIEIKNSASLEISKKLSKIDLKKIVPKKFVDFKFNNC